MSDLISRQAAIDAADEWDGGYDITRESMIENAIKAIPPAELIVHESEKDARYGKVGA